MIEKLKVLDLFSGIGGFSLGLERTGGFKTVAFCEIEEFPRKVLKKCWPSVPIYEDVRKLDGSEIDADVITGGYPCQPFSNAGKRRGEEDDRHLWPEMFRLIKAIRPRWVIAENVAGHINMGLDAVLSDLEGASYTWWTFVIPACAVDAKHRRDRVWIVANAISERRRPDAGAQSRTKDEPEELPEQARLSLSDDPAEACGFVSNPNGRGERCLSQDDKNKERGAEAGAKPGGDSGSVSNPRLSEPPGRNPAQGNHKGSSKAGIQEGSGPSSSCGDVADADTQRQPQPEGPEPESGGRVSNCSKDAADTNIINDDSRRHDPRTIFGSESGQAEIPRCWEWEPEPPVGRVAHGIPSRVDRLKGLGNAVVPQIPEQIGHAILETEANG